MKVFHGVEVFPLESGGRDMYRYVFFALHTSFFSRISEQTKVISVYTVNCLALTAMTKCVCRAVRTRDLNIFFIVFKYSCILINYFILFYLVSGYITPAFVNLGSQDYEKSIVLLVIFKLSFFVYF